VFELTLLFMAKKCKIIKNNLCFSQVNARNPAQTLLRCVINQAIADCVSKSKRCDAMKLKKDAEDWISLDNQEFLCLCELAEVNPKEVILLKTYKQQKRKRNLASLR